MVRELLSHLASKGQVVEVSEKFAALRTNSERVDFAYALLEENSLLPAFVEDFKNNEHASKLRQEGNEMFKLRKNGDALELYTKCVALAEDKSESLGLAFANRSAVLFEKGFYQECLLDIERAFENNYPEHLKSKLLARQKKAEHLKLSQTADLYFQPIPEIPESSQNEYIQCASNSIEIKYTIDQGRHIVATKDIAAGEVLAIEKPFCHILIEQYYNHCHECLKLCYNLIACSKCTQALYCSEDCQRIANAYHMYECRILRSIRILRLDKLKLLPMKIAIAVKSLYKRIPLEFDESEMYRSDRYGEIHNLVANTEKRSVADLFKRSVTAATIYHLVKTYTDFFEEFSEEVTFKELILRHLQTAPCNFHEISELFENKDGIFEQKEIGAGAYSFLSMFNHSCSPNVVRYCYGTTIVVRALHTIERGAQCFDNYGYHYALTTRPERRENLKNQYFFDCTCEVCEDDWPLYKYLPEIKADIHIDDLNLVKLQKGDVEWARKVLRETLPKMAELEKFKPNRNLAELQEVIKQCFALLGNIRKTF